jgi:putative endonuclease
VARTTVPAVSATETTGRIGQDAAERVYVGRGYRVLARNWRCRLGELDLVLARADQLVFCEVKTRRGARYGGGWAAVDGRKRAKLRSVGEAYLLATPDRARSVRFDVASVALTASGAADVQLFEDAF